MLTSYQSAGQSSGDIVTIRQLEAKIADLEQRLLKIEKTPATATQVVVERELDDPIYRVTVNKKTKEVYAFGQD